MYKEYTFEFMGVPFSVRYLGAEVTGSLKWWANCEAVNIAEHTDELWHTKSEAIEAAKEAIEAAKINP